MSLKAPFPFSIFHAKSPSYPPRPRPSTEIRFSRWNNANAEKFRRRERAQKEIEDDIRRERRYQYATNIAENFDTAIAPENPVPEFKSLGTPSSPSLPSIPGKSSKYSKSPQNPRNPQNPNSSHPAFRRISKVSRVSTEESDSSGNGISLGENGIAYRVRNAPFEFQYSYTETPKVKPLALREAPYLPFGPSTMPRPWTGRAPLPPSKKKLPEFDSFRLPPPHKKGVKPVQKPGPFLSGSGPKYVRSREEILGEPLTAEEIKDLIRGCLKTSRQLNMGRDGLTHNMLENIHAHWKRRRVCKIKCKGVCTVDMNNVRQQLEEKTGGKIIYSRGGVLFLFRGRNYNYRTRPKFPLMLWKPITPVYPRLVPKVPEGLTLEEASEMRKRGRKLPPICKLGKNGVYSDLVKNVREAFEECDLVRISCQGMNTSDYKKIGGKLKDLVPCVLISFEHEHILMWRGRDWKSSFSTPENESNDAAESTTDNGSANSPNAAVSCLVLHETSDLSVGKSSDSDDCSERQNRIIFTGEDVGPEEMKDTPHLEKNNQQPTTTHVGHSAIYVDGSSITSDSLWSSGPEMVTHNGLAIPDESNPSKLVSLEMETHNRLAAVLEDGQCLDEPAPSTESSESRSSTGSSQACTEGVLLLLRQAIESGRALVLDDDSLDANIVYERSVALAKTAPPGPVFMNRLSKVVVQKSEKKESRRDLEVEEVVALPEKRGSEKKSSRYQRKDFKYELPDVIPHGSLRIDELAKLLS